MNLSSIFWCGESEIRSLEKSFLWKQKSRVYCENWNPVYYVSGPLLSQGQSLDSHFRGNDTHKNLYTN
jgi:hypothetical protein